jgi:type II secretory pathway pseudopilin PulG
MKNYEKGFSVVEIILATAIFIIFSSGAIFVILQGFEANRLSEEEMVANQYASEGLEAARSIKNLAYSNLSNSTGTGLTRTGANVWGFSGASNAFGKYTRVLTVSDVQRDGSGNIVASGGNVDSNTKKVTSTVSWNASPTRNNSVILSTYLTNWEAAISTLGSAILMYGDSVLLSRPQYRIYTDGTNAFSTEADAGTSYADLFAGKSFDIKTSPTKQEAIAAYVSNIGTMRVLCFDGTNWTSDWNATVGGSGTNDLRFGIAYEKTTGDALIVYSTGGILANEMAYRTKSGSSGCGSGNWSNATTINTARTNGAVHWIRMEPNPVSSSNNIALAWADSNGDLSAMQWTGSSFGIAEPTSALETNLERDSISQDTPSFDITMESATGNLMVAWGLFQTATCTAGTTIATTNCIRYARYTSSWSTPAVIPTIADKGTNVDMSSHPNTNEIVLGALDNDSGDMSLGYWSGSTWVGSANVDTNTEPPQAGNKMITTGWLTSGSTSRSIIVYDDAGAQNIGWYVGNGSTFALQTDFIPTPTFGIQQRWYDIQVDPKNSDRLMFLVADNTLDLFAKRLVMTSTPAFTWTNSDGGSAIETNLGQSLSNPFSFAYWRN